MAINQIVEPEEECLANPIGFVVPTTEDYDEEDEYE